MLWSKPAKSLRPGDLIIFSLPGRSTNPGLDAKDVRPERHGEGYLFTIEHFWVVANTHGAQVAVRTRQGGIRILDTADGRMHVASWWERLIYRRRFPRPACGTPHSAPPA
jgi:hypothetical protein